MYQQALNQFHLKKPFTKAGFFETDQYKDIYCEIARQGTLLRDHHTRILVVRSQYRNRYCEIARQVSLL